MLERSGYDAALDASLTINYTLSASAATGRFLTELVERRLVGARCDACARTLVPAQQHCPRCAGETELVAVAETGTVSVATERRGVVLALIRLDGTDVDLLHRVRGAGLADLSAGTRVRAAWAAERTGSILDIEAFEPTTDAPAEPAPLGDAPDDVIAERPYGIDLKYRHAYGRYYGRLFDELEHTRRIIGARCPSCSAVLVPPRPVCEVCFVPTAQFEDVAESGVLRAFSVIHLAFEGQVREPPYVYAEITLDGASTRLIHVLGGFDVLRAETLLRPGMPVRAVWVPDSHTGTLADIDYFEPIFDD